MVAIKRNRITGIVEVGKLDGSVFVGLSETEFVSLVVEAVLNKIPAKLSYTVKQTTIQSIMEEVTTSAVEEVLGKIKLESRR